MKWLRATGAFGGVLVGLFGACTDRTSPERSVAREFAAHLCPNADACPCEHRLEDCEDQVLDRVGSWERRALELGLTLDEDCLDGALETLDGLAACGREWFDECYVYVGDRGVGEPCEWIDWFGVMSPCSHGLLCHQGVCAERHPVFAEGEACATEIDGQPVPIRGRCGEGLRCNSHGSLVCTPPKPTGSVCTANTECAYGDFCRGETPEMWWVDEDHPGTCTRATKQPGETCEIKGECIDSGCIDGRCIEIPQPTEPTLCEVNRTILAPEDPE